MIDYVHLIQYKAMITIVLKKQLYSELAPVV